MFAQTAARYEEFCNSAWPEMTTELFVRYGQDSVWSYSSQSRRTATPGTRPSWKAMTAWGQYVEFRSASVATVRRPLPTVRRTDRERWRDGLSSGLTVPVGRSTRRANSGCEQVQKANVQVPNARHASKQDHPLSR